MKITYYWSEKSNTASYVSGLLKHDCVTGDKRISGDLKEQITVKNTVSVREQSTNYLGFSNWHQPPMYQLLQKEAVDVK